MLYRDSAQDKSTIIDWYAEFECGHTNADDAERSRRPKSVIEGPDAIRGLALRSPQT